MPTSLLAEINDANLTRSAVMAGQAFGHEFGDEPSEEQALSMVHKGAGMIRVGVAVAFGILAVVVAILAVA